jgi:hypothetical protein
MYNKWGLQHLKTIILGKMKNQVHELTWNENSLEINYAWHWWDEMRWDEGEAEDGLYTTIYILRMG